MRHGDWITTYTGRHFYVLDPRAEDVDPADLAHALSLVCRFSGHCRSFYSVAQHSVHVAEQVPEHRLEALLHDAYEAYTGDIARPWKLALYAVDREECFVPVKELERRLLLTVYQRFGIVPTKVSEAAIHRADDVLLATEARDLMLDSQVARCIVPLDAHIDPWPPERAERTFLEALSA